MLKTIRLLTKLREPALRASLLCLISVSAFAQSIQLSSEQQLMLDQLPPAQQRQAMNALRQLSSSQQDPVQQTINETIGKAVASAEQGIPGIIEESRAAAGSRIVLEFELPNDLTNLERAGFLDDLVMQSLLGSRLYVLDDSGLLILPGLETIPLLGLTEEDIERRLEAEPYLSDLMVDARILSQEPIGVEALKPFGKDIFEPRGTSLNPPSSGPVPSDYILGPGDSVRVQLFGNVNGIHEYEVSRDGVLNLPELGPVTVAGISFSEFRQDLHERVKEMLIGTRVSVTMGQLRTIRVFVLGDVNQPGSYVVSGLATISSTLYQAGGISSIGSLRNIQLKRAGKIVGRFDAYDLLIRGDTSGDNRLRPGDVIFVPPIGKTVTVGGAVNRPAVYEVQRLTTAADLVGLAGGLTPEAYATGARLERIDEKGERTVFSVDLNSKSANDVLILNGDTLLIPEVLPEVENAVVLAGHVHRPGNYPWREGMRLSDLISTTEELKPGVDTDYILIRRENKRGEPIEALSASLSAALLARGSAEDVQLKSGDTVNVFSMALGRQRVVEPLLAELHLQSTIDAPALEVQISGDVRAPGVYPLEKQMRVSDLIRAGGNLTETAYALEAELTRYLVIGGTERSIEQVKVDLDAIRDGVESADLVLREHDFLRVNRVPEWDTTWTVSLEGEVTFPGDYRVRRGETLADVLRRAGGLTENAFAGGSVFLRESLKEQEREQIETLTRRLEADLASLSMQSARSGNAVTMDQGRILLDQLQNTEPTGRLVINLDGASQSQAATDIQMRDGDRLLVPTHTQVVTVLGETQQNTSHLYDASASRDDYISMSGGLTRRADKRRIYVVRANGAVVAGKRSRWLRRNSHVDIQPGDTIVVPLDADKMRPMTFWTNVTQILYQGAIAVAAVKTFDK